MSESAIDSCTWPITPGPCCQGLPETVDPAVIEAAIRAASDIMRTLSGGYIGLCLETLRPLHQCPSCRVTCCGGADGIGLSGLNGAPVSEVIEVSIGPDVIDPAEYWFDADDQVLYRVPPQKWPNRDVKWQDCGDGGAFCIQVLAGTHPDAWALRVADTLACELVKDCLGQKCRLPRNTTAVTAQGVSVELTGSELTMILPELSSWVAAVNPLHQVAPSQVWSPDTDSGRQKLTLQEAPRWLR